MKDRIIFFFSTASLSVPQTRLGKQGEGGKEAKGCGSKPAMEGNLIKQKARAWCNDNPVCTEKFCIILTASFLADKELIS